MHKQIFLCLVVLILVIGIVNQYVKSETLEEISDLIVYQEKVDLTNIINEIYPEKLERIKEKYLLEKSNYYKIKYLSDGLEVVGFIVKPKKEGKYPIIIYNRGGNREYSKISEWHLAYFSYLSSHGYVVVASQYRGSDGGEGKDEFGGRDVNDVLNLIKVAKNLPFVRPEQTFMLGYSRGGMMTYLAIKNGADINAAAVVSGITDLIQTYKERDFIMKITLKSLIGGTPDTHPEKYKNRSAFFWPDKIYKPVLILHGAKDSRINVTQAKKLAKKLGEIRKVDYKIKVYSEGEHGLNNYWDDKHYEIFNWFNKHKK